MESADSSINTDQREALSRFLFRDFHPNLVFGTTSDRYAGWIGQIYSEKWAQHVETRDRNLGDETYEERRVPVATVREYFSHFPVLELDFTFYRPLLDTNGEPTSSLYALQSYARHAPDEARFVVKAPQQYFSPQLRKSSGSFVENGNYLNHDEYTSLFYQPLRELLGPHIEGIILQQPYRRVADSPSPEENIEQMDDFFTAVPGDIPLHIELRSEHLLTPAYFDWLDRRRLGFIFSHWTWLPRIRKQWELAGEQFLDSQNVTLVRLLTPRNMKYQEAYKLAYPFDEPAPELSESEQASEMIDDTTALAVHAIQDSHNLMVLANNRAYGNAPALARDIGYRFLQHLEKNKSGGSPQ